MQKLYQLQQERKEAEKKENPALTPSWKKRTHETHKKHLEMYSGKNFKVAFLGDSMMERWLSTKYWNKHFSQYANLGVGGDRTQHLLWRIAGQDGGSKVKSILDEIKVEKIILMIGTNNTDKRTSDEIWEGIEKVIKIVLEKQPEADVVVYNVLYRKDIADSKIDEINFWIENYIKKSNNPKLSYKYFKATKADLLDNVHLNPNGYKRWFDDLKSVL